MPESYPGEHVMRAEIMANSTEPELSRESIMLSIFRASNNLGDLGNDDTWDRTVTGLRQIGAMNGKLDLRSFANNITISAFMEKLFHAAFRRVIEGDPRDDVDMMGDLSEEECEDMCAENLYDKWEPMCIVRWLLSAGHKPDTSLWIPDDFMSPLQHSLSTGMGYLVQLLLGM
jgi:hypothetical protein